MTEFYRNMNLAEDGAWCWFSDPRGFYHCGINEHTYLSWITSRGHIRVCQFDHRTNRLQTVTVKESLEVNDHDNPTIVLRPDGRLMIFYCRHTCDLFIYYRISVHPEDISAWGEERFVPYISNGNVTYPVAFFLPAEDNRLFLIYRGLDWQPTLQISDDWGETWSKPVKIIQGAERPYTKLEADSRGRIHIAFTDGHPRDEQQNRIYYLCYEKGAFYRSDGRLIKRVEEGAVTTTEAELVYDASLGKAWIWDIAADNAGFPVIVYAVLPGEKQHYYRYVHRTAQHWEDHGVASGGSWFPETPAGESEREPHYSGGIVLDHDDPSAVFLSRQVRDVFEIEKWVTLDGGNSWLSVAITADSHLSNVRPFVPRQHRTGSFDVVWMQGHYVHYTNYSTSLKYCNL